MNTAKVNKEMAAIRSAFGGGKKNDARKREYVWKLLYVFLLGYPVDIGQMQSVHLCSSTTFSDRYTAKFGLTLS